MTVTRHCLRKPLTSRSVRNGAMGIAAMLAFYVVVVWWASGSFAHLADQLANDWYLIGIVATGFGIQVALVSELRRRHRLHATEAAASGAGAGASVGGMIACCAHHIAELLPFLGLSGSATFLYDYRLPFIIVGVGMNGLGISVAVRRLRQVANLGAPKGADECTVTALR